MLLGAQETNGIVNQNISLNLFRKMPARDKLQSGGGPDPVFLFNQIKRFMGSDAIPRFYGPWHHPAHVRAGSLRKKILTPIIRGYTPGIRNGQLRGTFQVMSLWVVPIEAAIGAPDGTVRRFHIGVEKHTFPHVNRTRWIRRVGAVCMMGVMVVKAAQKNLPAIGPPIPVIVGQ